MLISFFFCNVNHLHMTAPSLACQEVSFSTHICNQNNRSRTTIKGLKKGPPAHPWQVGFTVGQVTFHSNLPDKQGFRQLVQEISKIWQLPVQRTSWNLSVIWVLHVTNRIDYHNTLPCEQIGNINYRQQVTLYSWPNFNVHLNFKAKQFL